MDTHPLDDDEFSSNIRDLLAASATFNYGDLADQRIKAMDYYLGQPFGDELPGQSQVVSTDVADTIEGILPYLMKIFTASDRVVEVDATKPETVELAEQATDYLNWLFYKKNRGFLVLYSFFKDALIQKNGIVKFWRERKHTVETSNYEALTTEELTFLLQKRGVEILGHATNVGDPELHDITVRETQTEGDVKVQCLPPEEFVVNRRHNSLYLQDAQLVCHRSRQTRSALLAMGFAEDQIDDCNSSDDWLMQEEENVRDTSGATLGDPVDYGTVNDIYLLDEIYVRMDKDGDGIDELYKVFMCGNELLDYEETDQIPFAAITPIIMTHRFHGRSVAELIMDIQRIKSTIQRQSLNNLYLTNNPRMAVLRNMVNIPDLMNVRPGGIVRMDQLDAVAPLTVPFVARDSFQVLQYFDDVKENRTGLTRYNQGMDANSLNKTATGINRIMEASKERIELIARIFAETGVAELFRGLLRVAAGGDSRSDIIKIRGKWVPMDPTEFQDLYDVTVNVGLGTGNKAEQIQSMQMIIMAQKEAAHIGMCRPIHFYNALEQSLFLAGHKDVDRFFTKPPDDAPMPQPPNPEEMKIKGEVQKHEVSTKAHMQETLQTANIEADATKYRITKQAETELAVAKIRGQNEVTISLWKEAMKLAAGALAKPASNGDGGTHVPNNHSVSEMAVAITQAAAKFMPEHMNVLTNGSPAAGPNGVNGGGPAGD